MTQLTLPPPPNGNRMPGGQARRVLECLAEGGKWTLPKLKRRARGSETGVSARFRDLRNIYGYPVDCAPRLTKDGKRSGTWLYWMERVKP